MATLLAFDYGHKKIGVAVGQTITGTAMPLAVVAQNASLWREMDTIFSEWRPQAVVIGEPKLADGKPHPLEKMIESFIITLKKRYNVKVYREDEALTSFEAGEYQPQEANKRGRRSSLDAHAAALFLESWLRYHTI